jgi:hypothetical protein
MMSTKMNIPTTKKLIVAFALLSLSAITVANQASLVAVHPADKVKVGNARLELGYKCEASIECYSSCCSKSRCSDNKACRKPKGIFTSLRDVSSLNHNKHYKMNAKNQIERLLMVANILNCFDILSRPEF